MPHWTSPKLIEELDGCVAGPVATLSEAMVICDIPIGGAIVDFEVADASQVVMLLAERNVPVIIQISSGDCAIALRFWR